MTFAEFFNTPVGMIVAAFLGILCGMVIVEAVWYWKATRYWKKRQKQYWKEQ